LRAEIRLRFFFPAAIAAWAFLAAACVHPLGPGYRFAERQVDIRQSEASPGTLHFHVVDDLNNAGDRPLRALDVRLPESRAFGEQNLRILLEGAELAPEHDSASDPRMMRAPFNPPWEPDAKHKVVTDWDLTPVPSARGTIVASSNGFFIADETALPLWQTPGGLFAVGGTIPNRERLTVVAPQDFLVMAPGKPLKSRSDGNQSSRSFLINPDVDFLTYVVTGRYQEKIIPARQGLVAFWTFQPVDGTAAQAAAERLSSSIKALTEFFGPVVSGKTAARIAEAPAELPSEFSAASDPGAASFPDGALLDPRFFPKGIADEAVLQLAEYELARTWFGWRVRPRPEAQILMGRGMGLFGLVVAAEGRGQNQRLGMVVSLIERYDQARSAAADKPLKEPPAGYSRAERISTGYRGALFLVALEDECGHDNLRAALREIIHDRAGSDTGYEELLAATEANTGKDLGQMFRTWLGQPGIPEAFRARYQKSSNALLRRWNQ
jgi:hypothetical protein